MPHRMGPPHTGRGPAESPYLVIGNDPLPRPRETAGTLMPGRQPIYLAQILKSQQAALSRR